MKTAYRLGEFVIMVCMLALFSLPNLRGQAANPVTGVEANWRGLLQRALPPSARAPARTTPPSAAQQAQERSEQIAHFLAIADEAKAFGQVNADFAKTAKALEAKSLLKAAFLGVNSNDKRLQALIGEIESDTSLPAKDRFEVVAMAEHLLLRQLAKSSAQARVAHEESARYLIRKFPDQPGGYSTLLGVAAQENDAVKVKAVTQEILVSPGPFAAKAEARVMAGRYELIGKSLADVANTALGRGNFFEQARDRQVVLYTWATWSPNSLTYAKEMLAKIPPGVLIIGYNLDRDITEAKKIAKREKLPGEHYYNDGGPGAWSALLLKLNGAPLVYVTDTRGVIREVAAQGSELVTQIAALK